MDFHEALKKLHASTLYKTFHKTHKEAFLAHAFVMLEKAVQEWQIGYYCPKDDHMISFIIDEPIEELPPAEVLKSTIEIHKLDPADVKITSDEMLAIAEKTRKQHYPAELPMKTFFLIQHLEEGAMYNLTYVTRRFTTLNIKILAKDGSVYKHSNESLIQFDNGK